MMDRLKDMIASEGRNGKSLLMLDAALVLILLVMGAFIAGVFRSDGRDSGISAEDAAAAVVSENDGNMTGMQQGTDLTFKKVFGLNAADYEGVVYYGPASNMDAEELLVVRLEDTSQAEAVTEAVEERLEAQKQVFEGYAPEQYEQLEDAGVIRRGCLVFYCVSDDVDAMTASFERAARGDR